MTGEVVALLVPHRDYQIEDTWQVAGHWQQRYCD
jgi:hypothetical protein